MTISEQAYAAAAAATDARLARERPAPAPPLAIDFTDPARRARLGLTRWPLQRQENLVVVRGGVSVAPTGDLAAYDAAKTSRQKRESWLRNRPTRESGLVFDLVTGRPRKQPDRATVDRRLRKALKAFRSEPSPATALVLSRALDLAELAGGPAALVERCQDALDVWVLAADGAGVLG